MILFHPYTKRSFESNLIGVLYFYSIIKKEKCVLIVNDEIELFLKSKISFFNDIIIVKNNSLFPNFNLFSILKQYLLINNNLKKLLKNYKIKTFITENDCMSFSQIFICKIINQKKIKLKVYQSMQELSSSDYILSRKNFYRKKYGDFFGIIFLKLKEKLGLIFLNILLILRFGKSGLSRYNYINRHCISGINASCKTYFYQLNAYKKFYLFNNKFNSIPKLIKHSISYKLIPLDLIFKTDNKIKNAMMILFPIEFEKKYLESNQLHSIIKNYKNLNIYVKSHPSLSEKKFEMLKKFCNNKKLVLIKKNSLITDYLINFPKIFDFSPLKSTIEDLIFFLNEREIKINYKKIIL